MNSTSPGERIAKVAIFGSLILLCLASCSEGPGTADDPSTDPARLALAERLLSQELAPLDRAQEILALGRAGQLANVTPLIRLLKHRSQCAFLLEPSAESPLGYKPIEFLEQEGPDVDPLRRVAAVVALERVGSHRAIMDLLLALDDGDAKVRAHAARALIRLGCRAGIPVLLDLLRERAYGNETANAMLCEITGVDMGFHQDAGYARREEARLRWVAYCEDPARATEKLPLEGLALQIGLDAEADRRVHFHVDMLGQFQFLYHEQARRSLRRLGSPALPYLEQGIERGLKEDRRTLRAGIAQVLSEIPHDQSLRLLQQLVKDPHPTVRSRAAISLAAIGTAASLHALQGALTDADGSVVMEVVQALGPVKNAQALQMLEAFDPKADRALGIARQAALFEASGGLRQREEILRMLVSEDLLERNAAHRVLVAVTGTDAGFAVMGEASNWRAAQSLYRERLEGR